MDRQKITILDLIIKILAIIAFFVSAKLYWGWF